MVDLQIKKLFPTLLGTAVNFLPKELHKNIVLSSLALKDKYSTNNKAWLAGENSPFNTFNTFNVASDENFLPLINLTNEVVHAFAAEYGDQQVYTCSHSWVNIYSKGNYQEPHSHINVSYSAVYFPKAPAGSGPIVFQNPQIYEVGGDSTDNSTQTWTVIPEDNMLIVFKSNLRHYVLQGNNSKERISIAMNYVIDPTYYLKSLNI